MKTAIYPGSFDPITMGHLDIIERASKSFDKLVVCVMKNSDKHPLFSQEERKELIERVTKKLPNVRVDSFQGLLAEYARSHENAVIVKGLRAMSDFESEFQMALINRKINPDLDTLFLTASEKYTYLSSSIVKEVAWYGGDISELVPEEILADIVNKSKQRR